MFSHWRNVQVVFRTSVRIGNRTTFGNDYTFATAGSIEIGDDVVAGQFNRFHSGNHNYSDVTRMIRKQGVIYKGIKIGNSCQIGASGTELGNGCVVSGNAVVAKKFPDNVVIAEVPARIITVRGSEE